MPRTGFTTSKRGLGATTNRPFAGSEINPSQLVTIHGCAYISEQDAMGLRKRLLRWHMLRFSGIEQGNATWEGYTRARNAATAGEKEEALLSISQARYEESLAAPLDGYSRRDLKPLLNGADALEIGCNHGGASLAYFELYGLRSITGLDIGRSPAETAAKFFQRHGVSLDRYRFVDGFAELLPFPAQSFDAVLSFDVWEHVQDVGKAMDECHRVLRPGGRLLLAFPSYYHPTQHHLFEVTHAPFIHWFWRPDELMDVYWDLLDEHPRYRDRIGVFRRPLKRWERLRIINGTTLAGFRRIVRRAAWSRVQFIPLPFGVAGTAVQRRPVLRVLRWLTAPATRLPLLEEAANQRIVYILTR